MRSPLRKLASLFSLCLVFGALLILLLTQVLLALLLAGSVFQVSFESAQLLQMRSPTSLWQLRSSELGQVLGSR